jgi:hypothetical protein
MATRAKAVILRKKVVFLALEEPGPRGPEWTRAMMVQNLKRKNPGRAPETARGLSQRHKHHHVSRHSALLSF